MKLTCARGGETSQLGCAVKLDSVENVCFLARTRYSAWIPSEALRGSSEKGKVVLLFHALFRRYIENGWKLLCE